MKTVSEVDQEARLKELWAYTLCSAALALVSEIYFDLIGSRHSGWVPLQVLRLAHMVLLVGIIVWLAEARRTLTARQCTIAGLLMSLPLPFLFWMNQDAVLSSNGVPDPLIGHHLAVILVAVLFPGTPRTVLLVVTTLALVGIVHIELWRAHGVPVGQIHEPWVLIIHWVAACVVVALRASLERIRIKYERARAALMALTQLASATRALRDGANTPLQTIETIAFLQKRLSPNLSDTADRLERSVVQLRNVLAAIEYEDLLSWKEHDVSFQAERRLARLREMLIRDAGLSGPGPDDEGRIQ